MDHTCPFVWTDGWGSHACSRMAEHDGNHRCACDASHTVQLPKAQPDDPLRLYGGVDQNTRHFPEPPAECCASGSCEVCDPLRHPSEPTALLFPCPGFGPFDCSLQRGHDGDCHLVGE